MAAPAPGECRAGHVFVQTSCSACLDLVAGLADAAGCPVTLQDWLESTLGCTPDKIRATHTDQLTATVDLLPLMKIAGGAWAALAREVEHTHATNQNRLKKLS